MDKTDMRLDGISKLLQQGMRMLVRTDTTLAELAQAQKRTDAKVTEVTQNLRDLARAQKATERSLKAFIDSLRHGRNGRNGG